MFIAVLLSAVACCCFAFAGRITAVALRSLPYWLPDRAARIIQDALGIEGDVVNYRFPQTWPTDRERRARVIGEWLKTEAPGLVTEPRRFPPPWSAEETDACFIEKPPRFGASNGRME
jgi:hypothetical protein